jgi:hypothetical protein
MAEDMAAMAAGSLGLETMLLDNPGVNDAPSFNVTDASGSPGRLLLPLDSNSRPRHAAHQGQFGHEEMVAISGRAKLAASNRFRGTSSRWNGWIVRHGCGPGWRMYGRAGGRGLQQHIHQRALAQSRRFPRFACSVVFQGDGRSGAGANPARCAGLTAAVPEKDRCSNRGAADWWRLLQY